MGNGRVNIVCLEIPFGVDSYRKETSQFQTNYLVSVLREFLLKGIIEKTLIVTVCE